MSAGERSSKEDSQPEQPLDCRPAVEQHVVSRSQPDQEEQPTRPEGHQDGKEKPLPSQGDKPHPNLTQKSENKDECSGIEKLPSRVEQQGNKEGRPVQQKEDRNVKWIGQCVQTMNEMNLKPDLQKCQSVHWDNENKMSRIQREKQQDRKDGKSDSHTQEKDFRTAQNGGPPLLETKSAIGKEQQSAPGSAQHEVLPLVIDTGKEKDAAPRKFSPLVRQVLAAAGPVMATVSSGMTTGYSAVLLPQLESANSTIPITNEQASWIASMAPLPMVLGCVLSGFMLDRLGRRRSQLVVCAPFTVGWVLLAVARDLPAILAGRFLTGLCVGLVGPPSLVYIGETAGPTHRGLLLAAISLAVALGILFAHVLGTVLHWRLTAWLCATAPLACVAFLCPSPESPVWLASKGKLDEASRAFRWLRGFDEASSLELQSLLAKHGGTGAPEDTAAVSPTKGPGTDLAALPLYKQILHRTFMMPFFVITVFFFIMQFSGVNAVAFYTVKIMKDVGGGMDEYAATIILDVVRVLVSCVACVLLRRVGRRPLAVLSTLATGVSMVSLAALLAFGDPGRYPWMPTTLLVFYITAVSLGLVPLPWVMAGEVFPGNLRGLGGGSTTALAFVFFFSVVKTGPQLFQGIGPAATFGLYGCVALLGCAFLFVFLPETKNRTLQEIEDEMAGSVNPKHDKKASIAEP